MDRNDLFRSFQGLGDDILERSETARPKTKKSVWLGMGGLAACLCVMAAALFTLPTSGPVLPPDASHPGEVTLSPETSDTYTTLPELLEALSGNESHTNRMDGNKGTGHRLSENVSVVVTPDGMWAYHIGSEEVRISRLDGGVPEAAGVLPVDADGLFLADGQLLVVSQCSTGEIGLEQELSTRVGIYNISSPANPTLQGEYLQGGRLKDCWMVDSQLWLVTEDGMCACGWSRREDTTDYYPALSQNGEAVVWGDEDISILGSPTRVNYWAVTVFEGGAVTQKQAFYGDGTKLFYGEGWLALVTGGRTDTQLTNPVVYTFDGQLAFTGKVEVATLMGADAAYPLSDGRLTEGTALSVDALDCRDGVYRLVGKHTQFSGDITTTSILSLSARADGTEACYDLLEDLPNPTLTEVLWEEDRAILCVATLESLTEVTRDCSILIAAFDGGKAVFRNPDLSVDYHDSRVGTTYGTPLGEFETLIDMGEGVYLRFSSRLEWPDGFADGFDVLRLTPDSCELLAEGQGILEGMYAFDYLWHKYDGDTFGVLKVTLGETDYFREVGFSWCVYDMEGTALTLQEEIPLALTADTFFGADGMGLRLFTVNSTLYYVTPTTPCPILLD